MLKNFDMKLKLKICLLAMLNFMKEGGGNDKIKMFVLHECKVLEKKEKDVCCLIGMESND